MKVKLLYRNSDLDIIDGDVHWSCIEGYYEKNFVDKLELNIPYTRSIDLIIPMKLTLTLNVNEDEVQNYKSLIKEIAKIANENDFYPFELLLLLQMEKNYYRIDHINCKKDIDNQELVIE